LTKRKLRCYTVINIHTTTTWRPPMLQLSLGYVVQADREREVAEDLRNRQSLLPPRDIRSVLPVASSQSLGVRRGQAQARVRGTGA
jgi:hypothetical protein